MSDGEASGRAIGAIVIGAGPAGLATAACLRQAGIETLLLEMAVTLGASWRRHYDRLRLHTDRGHSGLPGLPMPRSFPRYPSRAQVVEYLEAYAGHFGLVPRFGITAVRAVRENGSWRVDTSAGTYHAPVLVVATGIAGAPFRPDWIGAEVFGGGIRHSVEYRNPGPYSGKRVLVVGFGNSGGEIALDLARAGVRVAVTVRSAVNIIPRDLFGVPILNWAIMLSRLPPRLADWLALPLVRPSIGSLHRLGLRRPRSGPFADIAARGRIPLIDTGEVAAIRLGQISLRPDVRGLHAGEVEFADGRREPYDAIIAATGFCPDLRTLLPDAAKVLDDRGAPKTSGAPTAMPGLYFCGFEVSPTGQLRKIGQEARKIASQVARRAAANVPPATTRTGSR